MAGQIEKSGANIFLSNSIFVIIPAFNEGRVIGDTVAPLIESGYSVVVVDDCSRDNTWRVLEGLPITRIHHAVNLGQGAALQTGMEYAARHGAAAVVHFDADGQHDWKQIPDLVAPILEGRVDVTFGSRFLRRSDAAKVPPVKRLVLRVGRIVSSIFTGVFLSDTHNGFRALSPKALAAVALKENRFAHATEILAQVRRARLSYAEVATTIRYTDYSKAKGQPISSSFNTLIDLILRKIFP